MIVFKMLIYILYIWKQCFCDTFYKAVFYWIKAGAVKKTQVLQGEIQMMTAYKLCVDTIQYEVCSYVLIQYSIRYAAMCWYNTVWGMQLCVNTIEYKVCNYLP